MNILDERDKRTIYRKIAKKNYDKEITLSVSDTGQRVRLLDEGMVVDAAGSPLFYIQKGTLSSYYNSLADDYVGSINIGHMDFATFPFILGVWTKKDLHLVEIGDGRQALDVDLRLDYDNYLVKTLQASPYDVGVSAEFTFHVNEEASKRQGIEILDAIFIRDFAIVGECGNVNSSGINLKGGAAVSFKVTDIVEAVEKELKNEDATFESIKDAIANLDVEETAEEIKDEAVEEVEETEEVIKEVVETEETEEVKEAEVEETEEEEKIDLEVILANIEELKEEITKLRDENEVLKQTISTKEQEEREFVERFKGLTISLAEKKTVERDRPVVTDDYTNGIGEF